MKRLLFLCLAALLLSAFIVSAYAAIGLPVPGLLRATCKYSNNKTYAAIFINESNKDGNKILSGQHRSDWNKYGAFYFKLPNNKYYLVEAYRISYSDYVKMLPTTTTTLGGPFGAVGQTVAQIEANRNRVAKVVSSALRDDGTTTTSTTTTTIIAKDRQVIYLKNYLDIQLNLK